MQRNSFIILMLLIFFLHLKGFSQNEVNNFSLSGIIKGEQDNYLVKIKYLDDDGSWINDSMHLKNNRFLFKGFINSQRRIYLKGDVKSIADNDSNATSFYIDPENNFFTSTYGNVKNAEIRGSKTEVENKEFIKEIQSVNNEKVDSFFSSYIRNHTQSVISLAILSGNRISEDSLLNLFPLIDSSLHKSPYAKKIIERITNIKQNQPGSFIQDFSLPDVDGKEINLADFKGNYVLIDFWASWCVPCRNEFPETKKIWERLSIALLK